MAFHDSFSHLRWLNIGLPEQDDFFQRRLLFLFGVVLIRTVRTGHQKYVCRCYSVLVTVFAYFVIGLQVILWTTLVMCFWMRNKRPWILCVSAVPLVNFAISYFVNGGLSLHLHSQYLIWSNLGLHHTCHPRAQAQKSGHCKSHRSVRSVVIYLSRGCSHLHLSKEPVDFTAE